MTFLDSAPINPVFSQLPLAYFGEHGISPYLIPIAGMAFALGAIVVGALAKAHRDKLQHDTIQRALEKGQPLPPDVFSQAALPPEFLKSLAKRPSNDRRGGFIAIAVGIGLYVFFGAMQSEGVPEGAKWLGLIPGLIGVALLINWALERGEKTDPDKS